MFLPLVKSKYDSIHKIYLEKQQKFCIITNYIKKITRDSFEAGKKKNLGNTFDSAQEDNSLLNKVLGESFLTIKKISSKNGENSLYIVAEGYFQGFLALLRACNASGRIFIANFFLQQLSSQGKIFIFAKILISKDV